MKLLERYIIKTVLSAIALVTLALAGLNAFILLVNQLDDLGKGDYGLLSAASVVLLSLPHQVYLFFPVASLLGCLLGLGLLANHHELIVMRSAGISITRVTRAVCTAAFVVILFVTLLGETWVTSGVLAARNIKQKAISQEQLVLGEHNVWVRSNNDFILLGRVFADNHVEKVVQFHFDTSHHLALTRKFARADYNQGVWVAKEVRETYLYPNSTQVDSHERLIWDVELNPARWVLNKREPDEMKISELYQLTQLGLLDPAESLHYQLIYWQRLTQPLTSPVMMLLAIPFVYGPLRSSTMGSKLLVGLSVGFGFHLLNRFFAPISQVLHWPPLLAALGPTVVFALLSFYLMRRLF